TVEQLPEWASLSFLGRNHRFATTGTTAPFAGHCENFFAHGVVAQSFCLRRDQLRHSGHTNAGPPPGTDADVCRLLLFGVALRADSGVPLVVVMARLALSLWLAGGRLLGDGGMLLAHFAGAKSVVAVGSANRFRPRPRSDLLFVVVLFNGRRPDEGRTRRPA